MLDLLTAAPVPATARGREWLVSPLTESDWGEFLAAARRHARRLVARLAPDVAPPDWLASFDLASRVLAAYAADGEGLARLLWLALRRRQPEATPDVAGDLLADPDGDVMAAFVEAQDGPREKGATASAGPVDRATLYMALIRNGLDPWSLTPTQILMLATGASGDTVDGKPVKTDAAGRKTVRVNSAEEAQALMEKLRNERRREHAGNA